jgi:hypothetical protein
MSEFGTDCSDIGTRYAARFQHINQRESLKFLRKKLQTPYCKHLENAFARQALCGVGVALIERVASDAGIGNSPLGKRVS